MMITVVRLRNMLMCKTAKCGQWFCRIGICLSDFTLQYMPCNSGISNWLTNANIQVIPVDLKEVNRVAINSCMQITLIKSNQLFHVQKFTTSRNYMKIHNFSTNSPTNKLAKAKAYLCYIRKID